MNPVPETWQAKSFTPYRVTAEILEKWVRNVIFEHCLPAFRGVEVTDNQSMEPGTQFLPAQIKHHSK